MAKNFKEIMYDSFRSICNMEIDDSKKIGMLTYLFSIEPNNWRVTGISIDALKVFHENDYKRKSKMGINRSHLKRRFDSYSEMMSKEKNGDFKDFNEWWNYFFDNDKTIIQTSSENMRSTGHSRIIEFENPDWSLFKSKGFAWNHGKDEINLLKRLYEEHCDD